MKHRFRLAAAVLTALLFLTLTGCGSGSNSFTWFVDTIPANLDPQVASAASDVIACENLYSGLVRKDPDGQLEPALCERWEVSADRKTYTFYLKDGLTYTAAKGTAADCAITAEDFVYLDAGSTTLALARAISGPALDAAYVTNGVAHARLLAQKGCRVYLPGGLLRPQTEAIVGAPAVSSIQQYNFTKAFMGANGVALEAGFTTPDPEEAAVKAAAVRRARESWFLVDDAKFAKIYPAVITDLHGGAILTNRCPNPEYKQQTFVKETEV